MRQWLSLPLIGFFTLVLLAQAPPARGQGRFELGFHYPTLEELSYSQDVTFDSSGDNYGSGVRWYPGGVNGSLA